MCGFSAWAGKNGCIWGSQKGVFREFLDFAYYRGGVGKTERKSD